MRQRNCEKTGMLCWLEVEFLSLTAISVAVSLTGAAPFTNMCSTQADNNSRKSRLLCGCQFLWYAIGLKLVCVHRKTSQNDENVVHILKCSVVNNRIKTIRL
jgi:hypothetical protein